jgi:ATPase subunit of ABC transporter with duplicated ATPase domains
MSEPLLAAMGITIAYPGHDALWPELDLSLHSGRRYGLVGANGGGKSTLLALLMGQLAPSRGVIQRRGSMAWLRQDEAIAPDACVVDALGLGAKLRALRALANGDPSDELHSVIGDDWKAEARATQALLRVGLDARLLWAPLSCLSGGELTRARLAGLWSTSPDLLLLDEPTNHLDREARALVTRMIAGWRGAVLVASHDRDLLGGMDEIWALSARGLEVYGGGYEVFAEQQAAETAAASAALAASESALAAAKRKAQETIDRQRQRAARGRAQAPKLGIPKVGLGLMKRNAERTLARVEDVHGRRLEEARAARTEARARLGATKPLALSLPETRISPSEGVLLLEDFNVAVGRDGRHLWSSPLDAYVRGPERIAISGANGVGKSMLLRAIAGTGHAPTKGSARLLVDEVAFLDQQLAQLDLNATALDDYRRRAPGLTETERRIRLGRLRLDEAHVHRPLATLSGGERLRVVLAATLLGERPARLLLLDEPSNHLDLESLELLERALGAFAGAMIVVSHDQAFLNALGITRNWHLDGRGLSEDGAEL